MILAMSCAAAIIMAAAGPASAAGSGTENYRYLSPLPGAGRVSPWNNVVIRDGRPIDPATVDAGLVTVTGSASGTHGGTLVLSDDGRTLVFRPDPRFAPGEEVAVALAPGIRTTDGALLAALAFDFAVSIDDPALQAPANLVEEWEGWPEEAQAESAAPDPAIDASWPCEGLPSSYPNVHVTKSVNPDPGYVFVTPFTTVIPAHLIILDDFDVPIFYRRLAVSTHNLFLQPDGRLTYFDSKPPGGKPKYYALDSTYAVVDSFATGNGYVTDSHDLVLLPNGHALLMSYDPEPVRMDLVVAGGSPNASVTGLIVQEIDAAKNVVFQWRSWDHFAITDLASPLQSIYGSLIDYVHGNSLELDADGNILLSSRHLNEVTKIDRETGAILWRWGLHAKHNDFTFIDDPRGFSHQHDVKRLPNGHITVFDNGNFLTPQYSRALEYDLDENAMTATLVWSKRNIPDQYASFLGSVQRRASGSTMISWSGATTNPKVTEVAPDGNVSFMLSMPGRLWTYRAYRFPWRTSLLRTDAEAIDFGETGVGMSKHRTVTVRNTGAADVTIGCIVVHDDAFEADAPLPATLPPGGELSVDVTFHPAQLKSYSGKIYLRVTTDADLIAQDVALSGTGVVNAPPDCSAAVASAPLLWPPDHRMEPVAVEGVTDPDGDPVTIRVDGVTQDEPPGDGRGDGDTCPDAARDGQGVRLRAERSALGNGRVYAIAFTADDGRGGTCSGTVTVCVPHDVGEDGAALPGCVDDGQTEDALAACRGLRGALVSATEAFDRLDITGAPMARETGRVSFTVPFETDVRLSVFDASGRRVRTLTRGLRAAGTHRIEWRTGRLAPGVYFYRLRAGEDVVTRTFVILR